MGSQESTTRQHAGGAADRSDRIVGRDTELARIDAFLARKLPATLVIEGEAGIGKSILWDAAVDAARAHWTVLAWRASEAERAMGFAGLTGLFDELAGSGFLERLAQPRRDALAVALGQRRGDGPPPEPTLVGLAVGDLLRVLAAERPVVVAIDDLQWLDEPSAGALAFAIRRAQRAAIAVVHAVRTADPGARTATRGLAGAGAALLGAMLPEERERLVLGPLSVGAIGRLVRDRLGVSHPRPLLVRLHAAINGNPFLAQEASRSLLARGAAPGPGEPLPVTTEASALVRDHLATLDPDVRRAVLAVALSLEPTGRLIRGVMGEAADPAIDRAVAHGVLLVDGPQVRAAHPLFASIVHEDATPGERRAMHRGLGELAASSGRTIEAAIHLGASVDEPDDQVADSIQAGADAAASRAMPGMAADLLERSAALTVDAGRRAARSIAAAAHALSAGDADRAERLLLACLASEATAGPRRAEALAALGEIVYVRAPAEGLALLRSATAHVGDDRLLEALIHSYIVGMADPDFEEAIRSADRAVELLDGLDGVPRNQHAAALLDRAFQWLLLGERVAVEDIDRGLALLDLDESSFLERRAEESAERCLWLTGRLQEAMALDEEQYRRFSERGQLGLLPQLLQAMATMRLHTGRRDLAERYTAEIEELVEGGEEMWRERAVMARAWLLASGGELDAARSLAVEALARQEAEGDLWEAVIYGSILGFVELSVPNPAAALERLQTALDRNDAMNIALPNAGGFLRDYVEAAVLAGRLELAESGVARFEAAARRLGLPWEIAMAARGRGLIQLAAGATEEAVACFDTALSVLEGRLMLPLEQGRVRLLRGEALRRLGHRREARAGIEGALQVFEAVDAKAWAARARAELGRLGGRAPAREALTASERSVVQLAAAGLSNREIAARLVVSVRTVENQLSSAYGKLGVSSRRHLHGAFAGLGPDLSGSTDAPTGAEA